MPDLVVVYDVHVCALDHSDHHGTLLNGFLVKKYMCHTLVVKFNCPLVVPDLVVVDDVHELNLKPADSFGTFLKG